MISLFALNRPQKEETDAMLLQLLKQTWNQSRFIEQQAIQIQNLKAQLAEASVAKKTLESKLEQFVLEHQQTTILTKPGTMDLAGTFPSLDETFKLFNYIMHGLRCDLIDSLILKNKKISKETAIINVYDLIYHILMCVHHEFISLVANVKASAHSLLSVGEDQKIKSPQKEDFAESEVDPVSVLLRQYMRSMLNVKEIKFENLSQSLQVINFSSGDVTDDLQTFADSILYLSWVCVLSIPRLYFYSDESFSDKTSVRAFGSNVNSMKVKYCVYPGLIVFEKGASKKEYETCVKLKGEVVT
jgi:hypothetical protein